MGRIYFALLLVGALAVGGCGRSKTYNGPNGEKVTVDKDNGSVEINATDKEGGNVKFSAGKGVSLPADFPKDAPVYPGAKAIMNTNNKEGMSVMLETSDAPDKVAAFYEKNLKEQGWTTEASVKTEQSTTITNKKEKRTLAVNILGGSDKTMIQLMVRQEK